MQKKKEKNNKGKDVRIKEAIKWMDTPKISV